MPSLKSHASVPARSVTRSATVTATWDQCPTSSPALRSPNALFFATRIALINNGLMAPGDHHQNARRGDNAVQLRLNSGDLSIQTQPLQRRCVLTFQLPVKNADQMAAVHAVIRAISQALGTDKPPVVAMETGQSESVRQSALEGFSALGSLAFAGPQRLAGA